MKDSAIKNQIGEFVIGGFKVSGKLEVNGRNSELYLFSESPFELDRVEHLDINGHLSSGQKVSLIDCIYQTGGRNFGKGVCMHHVTLFPHYIVLGNRSIESKEKCITSLTFILEHATSLFYDYSVFGSILNSQCDVKSVLGEIIGGDEKVELGEHLEIYYFTGKHKIFDSKTCYGELGVYYAPTLNSPNPKGIQVDNQIRVQIDFDEEHLLRDALVIMHTVKNFFDLNCGLYQKIGGISALIHSPKQPVEILDVVETMNGDVGSGHKQRELLPIDVLINGGIEPNLISKVVSSWLRRQSEWSQSRWQYFTYFKKKNSYSPDRLVAAANTFDILPENAIHSYEVLSEEIITAVKECKTIVKKLPNCYERMSILGALGRVGRHNLRSKIMSRSKLLTDKIPESLPDLELVVKCAVNSRNYFVHGTVGKMRPEIIHEHMSFLTNTLEFIFAASDLVEAGWDIRRLLSKDSSSSHPFAWYLRQYPENLVSVRKSVSDS